MKYLALLSFIIITSCHKHKASSVLPEKTQTGANTIGFMIGDLVWSPFQKCALFGDPCGRIRAIAYPYIDFQFGRTGNSESSLTIATRGSATIFSTGEKIDSISVSYTDGSRIYDGPMQGSSFTIIRFDTASQVISGEFNFVLYDIGQAGKTIELRNGRFDLKFNTCTCD